MFDKKQTANFDAANFLSATLGLFLQTVLCWSKAGSERVTKTELSTLNRLSAVWLVAALSFPPDYKHSSGRQQQTGRRPYAILVRHNPLLGGSWTKSTSKGSESNQECKFRQIHENTRTSTVFISDHLPLFSCILVPKRRTTTKSRTAPIVAANQTATRLLTSPCAEEDGRW